MGVCRFFFSFFVFGSAASAQRVRVEVQSDNGAPVPYCFVPVGRAPVGTDPPYFRPDIFSPRMLLPRNIACRNYSWEGDRAEPEIKGIDFAVE